MPRPLPFTVSGSSARALLEDLSRLRTAVADEGAATVASWAPALRRPAFEPAALNLAHYLALRRCDVRDLQIHRSRHQHKKAARLAPLGSWIEPQTL